MEQEVFDNADGEKIALIDILADEAAIDAEEQMCYEEMTINLREAIDILDDIQKKFLYLSYVKGLKLKEIEKELCMNTYGVRKLRKDTFKKLKNLKKLKNF